MAINMKKVDRPWFELQLDKFSKTQRMWAKALGIDPSAVTRILDNERKMTLREAGITADFLGMPLETVLERAGLPVGKISPNETGRVPVVGTIDGKGKVDTSSKVTFASAPSDASKSVIALKYKSAMTALDAFDNAVVYYDPGKRISEDALGRLSVAETESREQFVGIIRRGESRGEYVIYDQTGAKIKDMVELVSASPILWIKM